MLKYTQKNIIKIVAILKANQTIYWAPLKITKQTHFSVTQTQTYPYKDFFIFQCG